MRVLCYGSLNLDHIYNVQAFVRPGETCKALSVEQHCGGKGFNQAVAAAKAGLPVSLAGCIGADGGVFVEKCAEVGIDTTDLCRLDLPTGNAVIPTKSTRLDSMPNLCVHLLKSSLDCSFIPFPP